MTETQEALQPGQVDAETQQAQKDVQILLLGTQAQAAADALIDARAEIYRLQKTIGAIQQAQQQASAPEASGDKADEPKE